MSQEQPPFGLPGPILAEIQRRPRSRIKFNCPPSVELQKPPAPVEEGRRFSFLLAFSGFLIVFL